MNKNKECPQCGGKDFDYDKMDLMDDGIEEHFGKTAIICTKCNVVIGYLED